METVRYALISLQDLRLGTGKFEVTLADGRTVMLDEINLSTFLSPLTRDIDADTYFVVDLGGIAVGSSDKTIAPANIGTQDSRTNTVKVVGVFFATTTGVPAAGIGTSLKLQAESADESPSDLVELQGTFSDVGAGSEDSDLRIRLRAGGAALTETVRFVSTGAVWIGTTAGNAAAILDLASTTRGFLPPRLTTTQRDAVAAPLNGLVVYNESTGTLDYYAAAAWHALSAQVPETLSGLTLSNNGTDPTNDIDVAAGLASSDDATLAARVLMPIGAITKRLDAAWVVGTNQGGLDTGTVTDTTYHVFLIQGPAAAADVLFSLSVTAPTLPTGYTKQRRIGSFTRAAGVNVPFSQDGDDFLLSSATLPAIYTATNPGTAAVTATLPGIPLGIAVQALFNGSIHNVSNNIVAFFSSLAAADLAPSLTASPYGSVFTSTLGDMPFGPLRFRTNTAAQIRYRLSVSGASDVVKLQALGWTDRRGRG